MRVLSSLGHIIRLIKAPPHTIWSSSLPTLVLSLNPLGQFRDPALVTCRLVSISHGIQSINSGLTSNDVDLDFYIIKKGLNAFDYLTGLRLALVSPNSAIVAFLFFLTLMKGEKSLYRGDRMKLHFHIG